MHSYFDINFEQQTRTLYCMMYDGLARSNTFEHNTQYTVRWYIRKKKKKTAKVKNEPFFLYDLDTQQNSILFRFIQ